MQKRRGLRAETAPASVGDNSAQVMTPSPWFPGEKTGILRVEVQGYSAETHQDGCGSEAEARLGAVGRRVFWE